MKLTIIALLPNIYPNNIPNNQYLTLTKDKGRIYTVTQFEKIFNNDELNVEGNWLRVLEVDVEIVGCK